MYNRHRPLQRDSGTVPLTWLWGGVSVILFSENFRFFFCNFVFNYIQFFRNTALGGAGPREPPLRAVVHSTGYALTFSGEYAPGPGLGELSPGMLYRALTVYAGDFGLILSALTSL